MENEFTIGQMAAMHATTVKTLRYYDQIGLLPPARVDAHSGYRYYTIAQFERLNTIQYLRQLGLPLAAIQAHLAQPDTDAFIATLGKQRQQVQAQIQRLQAIDARLAARIQDIQTTAASPLAQPFLQAQPQRWILRLDTAIRGNTELELALRQLDHNTAIFIGGVGLLIEADALRQQHFRQYSGLFVLVDQAHPAAVAVPAGDCACLVFNGDHTQAAPYYRQLLAWLDAHDYQLAGPAMERTIIDQDISATPAAYRTEIQLPIRR